LTQKHKDNCLEWAMPKLHWRMRRWRNVLWSDESYVCLDDKKRQIWVTRTPEEKWEDDCCVGTWAQSSIRAMVWGCVA
ncbi:hypothetical protein DL96DRAFT_1469795, partial [Flagelloscypha sp. PMI_526]